MQNKIAKYILHSIYIILNFTETLYMYIKYGLII